MSSTMTPAPDLMNPGPAALAAQLRSLADQVAALPAVPPPVPAVSPDNIYITAGGTIWDTALAAWTIAGGHVVCGAVADKSTANVVGLLWLAAAVWHVNTAGAWYRLAAPGSAWPWAGPLADPRVPPAPPAPPPVTPPAPPGGVVIGTSGSMAAMNFLTPGNKAVKNTIYGYASSEMAGSWDDVTRDNQKFQQCTSAGFLNAARQITIPLVRMNWDNDGTASNGSAVLRHIYPTRASYRNDTPDWSWYDKFLNSIGNPSTRWLPVGFTHMICMGTPAWCDISRASDRAVMGQIAVKICRHASALGCAVTHIEPFNERDGGAGPWGDPNIQGQCLVAIRSALAGAGITGIKLGGMAAANPWSTGNFTTFAKACSPDFISWHRYLYGSPPNSDYPTILGNLQNFVDLQTGIRNALAGTPAASVPLFLGEYNWDWDANDALCHNQEGGVLTAKLHKMLWDADPHYEMGGQWDLNPINNNTQPIPAPNYMIQPCAWMMSHLAQVMHGLAVPIASTGQPANLDAWACVDGTKWCVQFINTDASNAQTIRAALTLPVAGAITRWEFSPANQNGVSSTITPGRALTIPAKSVVTLHGG